jgi:nicotinate-nucleotide adenylyltransferase
MKRIALFGGTFDPIHRGHRFIAECACEQCDLDKVLFVPCWHSPHKLDSDPPTAGEHRLRMIKLAVEGLSWAGASSWEMDRAAPSYSWQTAKHFRGGLEDADQLYWIIGMDQWQAIERWSRIELLSSLVEFIVFPRFGLSPKPKQGIRARFLTDAMEISSTKIRTQKAEGLSITNQVEAAVARYIKEKDLYQAS